MAHTNKWWASVFVALAGLPAAAGADTLAQAITDAYRYNPRLQAQRASLRALDERVIQAASPYRLSATTTATVFYQDQRFRDPFSDQFFPSRTRQMSATISASQILFNGGRTAAQVSVAEASVLAGREALRLTENGILFEVVDSYSAIRRDQELVSIQQQVIESYQRQVVQAEARERGGDLTRTDIAQAQAQLEIARSQLAASRAQLEASRARFAAVVGRNPADLEPQPALPGIPLSLPDAFAAAERESPALWQAILNERAAAAQVSAERAERNPVLSISGSAGIASPNSYRFGDLGRGYSGQATLSVPLLTAGVVGSRVRAAAATRQQQQFLVEDTRRNVQVDVQNAWNQSVTARDQITIGESGITVAQRALDGVRRGFQEGFRSNFELLDSEQRLLNTRVIVANARYLRYIGQAALLSTLGRLEAATIDPAGGRYDAEANLERQRRRQFGPLTVVVAPLDRLAVPSSRIGEVAPLPPPPPQPAAIAVATTPPPSGGLGTTLPVTMNQRPSLPPADVPPPAAARGREER